MSRHELLTQLSIQLDYIRASCDSWDRGRHTEAARIAVAVRVLFHDTNKSVSLLQQLGDKARVQLLDTGNGSLHPDLQFGDSLVSFYGAISEDPATRTTTQVGALMPKLHRAPIQRMIPVDQWWSNNVFVLNKRAFSRRALVLAAANKDGGAHVDLSTAPEAYQALKKGISTLLVGDEEITVTEHQSIILRQLGYEVLNSPDLTALK